MGVGGGGAGGKILWPGQFFPRGKIPLLGQLDPRLKKILHNLIQ